MTTARGIFIVIDGIDGAGKTTLSGQLETLLADYNPKVTKEPTGDSEWGRRLRLSAQEGRMPRETETEYFHKDRLYHIENFIAPNLADGRIVICDRYVDSTLAFQARDEADAERMYRRFAPEILIPDISFILRCPVPVGLQRISDNRPTKSVFEKADTLELAHRIYESRISCGGHYVGLDASGLIEHTLNQALQALVNRFPHTVDAIQKCYSRIFPEKEIPILPLARASGRGRGPPPEAAGG